MKKRRGCHSLYGGRKNLDSSMVKTRYVTIVMHTQEGQGHFEGH